MCGILDQREKGELAPRRQAENLGCTVEEIENATKRLKRLEEQVARELGFPSKPTMLAGGLKVPDAHKPEPLPTSNGAAWTWLFAASYVAAVGSVAACVVFGYYLRALGAAAAFAVLTSLLWILWFRASWRAIPPNFRYATTDHRRLVPPAEMLRPLFVPVTNMLALFEVTAGLCYAIDFSRSSACAPRGLVRLACWLSTTPGIVFAPPVWVVAMHRMDRHTAIVLDEWHRWMARDAARYGDEQLRMPGEHPITE